MCLICTYHTQHRNHNLYATWYGQYYPDWRSTAHLLPQYNSYAWVIGHFVIHWVKSEIMSQRPGDKQLAYIQQSEIVQFILYTGIEDNIIQEWK